MSSGLTMWCALLVFLIIWGLVDWYIWHAWDGETATRFAIKLMKRHRWTAWAWLAAIVGGAIALLLHLEVFERL